MRTCALFVAAAAALSLAFAPAPLPKPLKPPKVPDWFGTWDQVGHPSVTFEITATHMTYHNAGGSPNAYFLTFDANKSPKTYDVSRQPGTVSFVGIWKVEGDTLTICYQGAGSSRPTAFGAPGGRASGHVETFTRKKR